MKNVYTANTENGKTITIEGGHVRGIYKNEDHTMVDMWKNETDYENYILGSTKGTKGIARVFIGGKEVFRGTVAEYDELCSIGNFI